MSQNTAIVDRLTAIDLAIFIFRPVIPRSTLGKTIRAYVESSESESEVGMDSEDEVELLGMGDGAGGRGGGGSNGGWDSKSSQSWRQVKA